MTLRSFLKRVFFPLCVCESVKTCEHYRKDSYTCNDASEADRHCGIRKRQSRTARQRYEEEFGGCHD